MPTHPFDIELLLCTEEDEMAEDELTISKELLLSSKEEELAISDELLLCTEEGEELTAACKLLLDDLTGSSPPPPPPEEQEKVKAKASPKPAANAILLSDVLIVLSPF
jgi:hypothetical protein